MANRVEIPVVVLADASPTSPVSGATATVKIRGAGTATVYSDSGATNNTVSQPLTTDSTGKLTGWLSRGAYEVIITVPGKNPYTEYLDIAPATDGGIDTAWIASKAVTEAKIEDKAVTTAKLNDSAVTAAKLGSNAVEAKHILEGSVNSTKILDGSIGELDIADSAVSSRKLKPTMGLVEATGSLTLAGGAELVPGLEFAVKPAVASILRVDLSYSVLFNEANQVVRMSLFGAGPVGALPMVKSASAGAIYQFNFTYYASLNANTEYNPRPEAYQSSGPTGVRPVIQKEYSRAIYTLFAA